MLVITMIKIDIIADMEYECILQGIKTIVVYAVWQGMEL
jgi:hypothetical protein